MKFAQGEKNNILGYIIDYEKEHIINTKNSFWFEETENNFTLNGYMTHIYLILGFDNDRQLKDKIQKIPNHADKKILNSCFDIIKITRNRITQHNKNKETLSLLTENEIYKLFLNAANVMVELFTLYNYDIYDFEDRRIESRKIKW